MRMTWAFSLSKVAAIEAPEQRDMDRLRRPLASTVGGRGTDHGGKGGRAREETRIRQHNQGGAVKMLRSRRISG